MIDVKIITDRLELFPVTMQEARSLHEIWIQPEVRKYLWDDLLIPFSQTEEIIDQSIQAFDNNQYGLWLAKLKDKQTSIGFCGYWPFFNQIQLIYGLEPNYWGKGLATEMVKATIDYGFDRYQFTTIYASTDPPNLASIALMKRLGMEYYKRETIEGKETIFYQISSQNR